MKSHPAKFSTATSVQLYQIGGLGNVVAAGGNETDVANAVGANADRVSTLNDFLPLLLVGMKPFADGVLKAPRG